MNLPELWFIIISVLFIGFFFLEGFDFGVGMLTRMLAKNHDERSQLLTTIGPFWDANEVWLITAGGALFAAFPNWYATMFSGYYTLFVLFLLALIVRGVGIEYIHHTERDTYLNIWYWCIAIGSFLAPFLLGMLFTSLVRGVPIDETMTMYGSFSDFVNIYSILGGLAVVLLSLVHGLTYIGLRTAGPVHDRAISVLNKVYVVLLVGFIIFAVLTYVETDLFIVRPIMTPLLLVFAFLSSVFGMIFANKRREAFAFFMSGFSIIFTVSMLFIGLFPRVMISTIHPSFNLTIYNAASGEYTLSVMTIVAVTLLPFVLGYQIWSYYVFSKRIHPKN